MSKSHTFNITPRSPVHIGTGEDINRGELALKKEESGPDKLYRADLGLLMNSYPQSEILSLIKASVKNQTSRFTELEERVLKHPKYWMLSGTPNLDVSLQYKEFIKTADKAYIPGSSIKGAIFSTMINIAFESVYNSGDFKYELFLEDIITKSIDRKYERKLNSFLFRMTHAWLDSGLDFMRKYKEPEDLLDNRSRGLEYLRWIQVTDSSTLDMSKNIAVYSLSRKGTAQAPKDINVEAIIPKKIDDFTFQIAPQNDNIGIAKILTYVNVHYRSQLKEEKAWFETRNIDWPVKVGNGKLLRVGYGSGNIATTLIPVVEKVMPKKLSEYGYQWKLTKSKTAKATTKWLANRSRKDRKTGRRVKFSAPLGWIEFSEV